MNPYYQTSGETRKPTWQKWRRTSSHAKLPQSAAVGPTDVSPLSKKQRRVAAEATVTEGVDTPLNKRYLDLTKKGYG